MGGEESGEGQAVRIERRVQDVEVAVVVAAA